jgi:hypothetical protein
LASANRKQSSTFRSIETEREQGWGEARHDGSGDIDSARSSVSDSSSDTSNEEEALEEEARNAFAVQEAAKKARRDSIMKGTNYGQAFTQIDGV